MKRTRKWGALLLAFSLAFASLTAYAAPESEQEVVDQDQQETQPGGQEEETGTEDMADASGQHNSSAQGGDNVQTDTADITEFSLADAQKENSLLTDAPTNEGETNSAAVEIPDENLAAIIRSNLEMEPDQVITEDDMKNLRYLYSGTEAGVKDLDGLEKAENLTSINLPNGEIEDLTPLEDLKNLVYIGLVNNKVSDITVLEGMSSLMQVVLDGNPAASYVFEKYLEPAAESIVFSENEVMVTPQFNVFQLNTHVLKITLPSEYSGTAELHSDEYGSIYTLTMKQAGTVTVNASYDGVTKPVLTLTAVEPEEEVAEEDKTDVLPELTGNGAGGVLYGGGIWDFSGEGPKKVSGDKKMTSYISRKVYFTDTTNVMDAPYEQAGLDENGALYYWPSADDREGYRGPVKVADSVQSLCNSGYLDMNGVYHFWKYDYKDGEIGPMDEYTVSGVVEATDGYLKLSDGRVVGNYLEWTKDKGYSLLPSLTPEAQIAKMDNGIALDESGKLYFLSGDTWEWMAGVKDYSDQYILMNDGQCLSRSINVEGGTRTVIAEGVDSLIGDLLVKDGKVYGVSHIFEGNEWRYELRGGIENPKQAVGELLLTEEGNVWNLSDDSAYILMNSVVSITAGRWADAEGYYLVREDGTVWRALPPLAPVKVFAPEGLEDEQPWTDTDEETGISGSANSSENIPEGARLVAEAVTEESEEHKENYTALEAEVKEKCNEYAGMKVYDISLMRGNTEVKLDGGKVQISIPLPEGFSANVAVLHQKDDMTAEILSCTVAGGNVVFRTGSFSLFALVDLGEKEGGQDSDPGTDPVTPPGGNPGTIPGGGQGPSSGAATGSGGGNATGTAQNTNVQAKASAARTGDESSAAVYGIFAVAAGAVAVCAAVRSRRRKAE